jgi:two-component system cell cycle sensor histidine kinase/response regulator CckA
VALGMFKRQAIPIFAKTRSDSVQREILQVTAGSALFVYLAWWAVKTWVLVRAPQNASLFPIIIGVLAAVLVLARYNYLKSASYLFLASLVLGQSWNTFTNGGPATPAYAAFSLIIILAGILFGPIGLMIVLIWTLSLGLFTLWAAQAGVLPHPVSLLYTQAGFVSLVLLHSLSGLVAFLTQRSFRQQEESKQELDRFFTLALDLLCIADFEGRFLRLNPAWEQVMGYKLEDMLGRRFMDFVHVEDQEATRLAMQCLAEGQEVVGFTNRYLHKDSSYRFIEWRSAPYQNRLVYAAARDVTEERRVAMREKSSEQKFSSIFQLFPNPITLTDVQGRVVEVNQAALSLHGFEREEVVGKTISDLNIWEDEAQRDLLMADLRDLGYVNGFEIRMRSKNGSIRTMMLSCCQFELNGGPAVLTVSQDITEQRQAEADRQRSEENFARIFELIPDPVAITDSENRLVAVNAAYSRITGWSREELIGRRSTDFGMWKNSEDRPRIVEKLKREGLVEGVALTLRMKSGEERHLVFSAAMTEFNGQPVMLTAARDITALHKAEEDQRELQRQVMQSQKLESLGVLAGGIAHDFNNLLTTILGNADLAMSCLSPMAPARAHMQDIEQASRRAADLCCQMLAYSGKGRFLVQALSMNELVREMGHLLSVGISKKVRLQYDLQESLPVVQADSTQLRQVVMNLITNANEAMSEKGGIIHISSSALVLNDEDLKEPGLKDLKIGPYVCLEVSDEGSGMDAATQARIFDPFFTTKFTGRGLGLAAVLGIVRGHHGGIVVHSQAGQGTAFKILLPAYAGPADVAEEGSVTPATWRGQGLVLVADDEPTVRTVGRRMLEKAGFTVLEASDGLEALDLFRHHIADVRLVLLDLTMPRMDGEACQRQMELLRPDVQILLTSGYSEQDVASRFAGRRIAGFVQKPFRANELIEKVRKALE